MSATKAVSAWAAGWPKLAAVQKAAQTNGGFIHRRFGDAVTSRYIPLGLACASTVFLVPGLFSMYLGINKVDE
ncbi:hypothetical protein COHA_002612 [Chlorella ohadii]|uniref:Uncharacterized protein n=1 Tax=Chlorella ohadii TaxID=2649997 RepID=A0AAD5DWH9_9CHLO|nr:hypothetical protein COHA_002612 [Chlorella ohadii]